MNDARDGAYPLMAANETLSEASGQVVVSDVASGKKVYEGTFCVPANTKAQVALLPEQKGQGMYIIDYRVGDQTLRNHYLYGEPPYDLGQYRLWAEQAGLVPRE
jgi:beta-mannosidase